MQISVAESGGKEQNMNLTLVAHSGGISLLPLPLLQRLALILRVVTQES